MIRISCTQQSGRRKSLGCSSIRQSYLEQMDCRSCSIFRETKARLMMTINNNEEGDDDEKEIRTRKRGWKLMVMLMVLIMTMIMTMVVPVEVEAVIW